jgi:uracil-DNA glycosylase
METARRRTDWSCPERCRRWHVGRTGRQGQRCLLDARCRRVWGRDVRDVAFDSPTSSAKHAGVRVSARANADRAVVEAKYARLSEAHVAPLVAFADEIAEARGMPRSAVPYPDPAMGGINARALFVLSTPGPYAKADQVGSGLLSLENNDPTAERQYHAYREAGLSVAEGLHWNAVPWPTAGRTPTAAEQAAAWPWLARLLTLLPRLRAVVLLGTVAQTCWRRSGVSVPGDALLLKGPHPSNLGMVQPGAKERYSAVMRDAAAAVRRP